MTHLSVALRQYLRHPAYALTVVGTLAITVGATTAVFAVVNAVLVRALPYAAPERLRQFHESGDLDIASVRASARVARTAYP